MRTAIAARVSRRLPTSVSLRPSVIPHVAAPEYNGDPGPSTLRRRSFSTTSSAQARQGAWIEGSSEPKLTGAAGRIQARTEKKRIAMLKKEAAFGMKSTAPKITKRQKWAELQAKEAQAEETPAKKVQDEKSKAGQSAERSKASDKPRISSSRKSDPSTDKRSSLPTTKQPFRGANRNGQHSSDRPTDHQGDPFTTSARVTEWVKRHPSPIKPAEVDELIRLVMDAPKYRVNTVVWNQLLTILAKENRLNTMFRALNFMKKRGYRPNSRTYTILLNAYAGARHMSDELTFTPAEKPTEKTWQRILGVYNESQANIMKCITEVKEGKSSKKDLDYGLTGDELYREKSALDPTPISLIKAQINPTPTNAYLKLLAKYGMWEQLDKVHLAMDKEGPLSPNTRTYQILFRALMDRWAQQEEKRHSAVKGDLTKTMSLDDYGRTVRLLWDEMVRRFHPANPTADFKPDEERVIDAPLAVTALSALMNSRPTDQIFAISVMRHIFQLPYVASNTTSAVTASMSNDPSTSEIELPVLMQGLPQLPLSVSGATTLLTQLTRANKITVASTWARHISQRPEIQRSMDFGLLRSIIYALGNDGDRSTIKKIMQSYQPTTGKQGWPAYIWEHAMMACRKEADFDAAMETFRNMTHLAYGTENGVEPAKRRNYVWHLPGGKSRDILGTPFVRPDAQPPTPKVMSLLFKTAFASSISGDFDANARKAYNVFSSYPMNVFFTIEAGEFKRGRTIRLLTERASEFTGEIHPSLKHAAEWRINLAKDVYRATDYMLHGASPAEVDQLKEMQRVMMRITDGWANLLSTKSESPAVGSQAKLRSADSITKLQDGMPLAYKSAQSESTLPRRAGEMEDDDEYDPFDSVREEQADRVAEQREKKEYLRLASRGGRGGMGRERRMGPRAFGQSRPSFEERRGRAEDAEERPRGSGFGMSRRSQMQ